MIHIKYELNDEERAILARSRVASATNRRWAIVMNALSAVLLLSGALWAFMQGERSWSTLYFASISVYFGALVVTGLVGRRAAENVARAYDLQVDDVGARGSICGREFEDAWKTIDSATDAGPIVLLKRRHRSMPLAIPKRPLDDAGAFWSLIDERLTAKRGLIARSDRTFIVNTTRL